MRTTRIRITKKNSILKEEFELWQIKWKTETVIPTSVLFPRYIIELHPEDIYSNIGIPANFFQYFRLQKLLLKEVSLI